MRVRFLKILELQFVPDKIFVNNNMGNLIPISRMTKYQKLPGIVSINHLDGKRLLTATANLR